MEMRYSWLLDQMAQQYFKLYYHPGVENIADYPTKHHLWQIHQHVRPYYIQMPNSPTELLRSSKPSLRRGYVGILGGPYVRQVPLPHILNYRKPSLASEQLPRTPEHCVVNTAMSKPSQPAFLNGATPFSTAQHHRRIRVPHSLTYILTQRGILSHNLLKLKS